MSHLINSAQKPKKKIKNTAGRYNEFTAHSHLPVIFF